MDIEKQKEYIKNLDSKRNDLNENSLPIMERAYKNAKKQIEIKKNTTYKIDKDKK